MGVKLSRYGDGTKTNLLKELDIDPEKIVQCEHFVLNSYNGYDILPLEVTSVKSALLQMEDCYYIETNFIYNTKNRIKLTYNDGTSLVLAMSDDENYVGTPTRASGKGMWFYLKKDDNSKYTPFESLLNNF